MENQKMTFNPEVLLPHLPHLRRHARLLTGSREVGDELVRVCLEMVVAEPGQLTLDDPRVGIFATFHSAWSEIDASTPAELEGTSQEQRLQQGLSALNQLQRRILLLIAVEEFSVDQTASILGMDAGEVQAQVGVARRNLDRYLSVPVLIIEDEPLIAMELGQLAKDMGLVVVSVVAREEQAVEAMCERKPGLVLADIQLQEDGSGLVAAQEILQRYDVPIVFVTGFPERLLTGEGLEPAFVVAKPFREEGLKAVISQALAIYSAPAEASEHRARLLAKLQQLNVDTPRATAHKGDGLPAR